MVGWQLSPTIDTQLVLGALDRALAERAIAAGIAHHSDRGVQYCAKPYVEKLDQYGFAIGMSRKGQFIWQRERGSLSARLPGHRRGKGGAGEVDAQRTVAGFIPRLSETDRVEPLDRSPRRPCRPRPGRDHARRPEAASL